MARLVRDDHRHIKKVAVVTDSHRGDTAEHLASHFVSAEIRHFPAGEQDLARQWVVGGAQ
ncbi:SpoIIAA family protein [Mycobacterium camsae]|uniref:STAS/SEC14 domain-containing protein n=1 Tax=Mycobacterium gordonae TaxID=1778 RepID=UPI00197FFA47|nr:STAS/SEC14 domain-containing protein [Mycobacterium gordonae]